MSILNELFYGNIAPNEKSIRRDCEYANLERLANKNEEKLQSLLTEEAKVIFEKYKECVFDMAQISEREFFIDGVKFGLKITVEAYAIESENFSEI